MRLVIATPLYPPDSGGPATYAALLERELPKAGVEVELVKFGDVRALPKLIRHFFYYRKVRHAAARADAVLALDPVSTGFPAMKAAQKEGKPFFVKIVGDYAWEQGKQRFGVKSTLDEFQKVQAHGFVKRLKCIQTEVALAAKTVIVPSEYLKGIVAGWGVPEDKIQTIYNAVSIETAAEVPLDVSVLPHPKVVTVGRLVPWKGIRGVIDAVKIARESVPGLGLVIVGDGPERRALETYAYDTLGLGYVFTGALVREEALGAMKDSDLFILNTSYEGFSHVLLEACLLKVPVLTTESGGNRELLNEDSALFSVVDASEEMARNILRVLTEQGLKERLAENAYTHASTAFGVDALVTKLKKVLGV